MIISGIGQAVYHDQKRANVQAYFIKSYLPHAVETMVNNATGILPEPHSKWLQNI